MNESVDIPPRNALWRDVIIAFAAVWALIAADVAFWRMGFGIAESMMWGASLFAMLFLPSLIAHRRKIDLSACTARLSPSWRDLRWGAGAMLLLCAPIALGHYGYMTQIAGHALAFSQTDFAPIAEQLPREILWQFLCVALPEEYFFRGFAQTNIAMLLQNSSKPFVRKTAPALSAALAALAFALVHVPNGGFARLTTFFPGCLFGFLRWKTDGLAAAVFAHASCNLLMFVLNAFYV